LLERIALHQTRLHTPGLGLDAKGVALGSKGLVLLPSFDRLVALLSVYTRERSLEDIMPSLAILVVRSKLGTREVAFEFAAESSDRMDRIADTARLVGGFAFTGTSRHFVQYRDAAAPFGYDATSLVSTDAAIALYHDRFSQTYEVERKIELRALLLRLMPRSTPSSPGSPSGGAGVPGGPRFLVGEAGLGPALAHYLVRSNVEGDVCVAEWPPPSAFVETPVRRWVFRIPEVPVRMHRLLETTPGITTFLPAGPGVAVEAGFRHPIDLRACPLFDPAGLVLLRGRGDEPWAIDRLPPMGALASLTRVELRHGGVDVVAASAAGETAALRVALRVVPCEAPWRNVTAAWIPSAQLPLLRRLAYALPHATIAQVRIALTGQGAFVVCPGGIEGIPLGTFFAEVRPRLYVLAGHEIVPAVTPEVLSEAFHMLGSHLVFLPQDARAIAIHEGAFSPLEAALLDAPPWEPAVAVAIEQALEEPLVDLKTTSVGFAPLRGVEPPATEG
jgi:hypothetical protein